MSKILDKTKSVCPECKKIIDAQLVEEDGKIYMVKTCNEHGTFKELVYHSDFYERIRSHITKEDTVLNCPFACAGCKAHKTTTILAVIDVTSRCNLNCEYCFANANERPYQPTLHQLKETVSFLRKAQPLCNAILFSGGEPTLRDDLFELLDHARTERFDALMIATNGVRIATDPNYAKELVKHGVGIIYLSFDGLDDSTNKYKKSHRYIEKLMKNAREAGLGIVLVPAVAKGVNNHQVYDIIKFAAKNIDIVRGVNFQPIGFSGRKEHDSMERYTIPDLCKDIEHQSNGKIKATDFFAVDTARPLTHMLEAITSSEIIDFSIHPMCGSATYLFVRDGKIVPITDFLDVEKFVALCDQYAKEIKKRKGLDANIALAKFILKAQRTIKKKTEILPLLFDIIIKRDYTSLAKFHEKALFVGAMHFMDPYNADVKRLQRCGVHYVTPNKLIVPFCAYNNFGYREKIEKQFSVPKCQQSNLGFKRI
jgi:uncharacterized radical SAM superfamily Fe-S cluster-containing enzyme